MASFATLLVSLLAFQLSFAQEGAFGNILVQYDSRDTVLTQQHKNVTVALHSGFDDTVEIYIDNQLMSRQHCKTDQVSGITNCYVPIKFDRKNRTKLLSIKTCKDNKALTLLIDRRLKNMDVHKSTYEDDDVDWYVKYRNNTIHLE